MVSPASISAGEREAVVAGAELRLLLVGRGSESLRGPNESAGLRVVDHADEAQAVVAYGGDGSLLGADREYPRLPKIPIRRDHEFAKCQVHGNPAVFERIARREHQVTRLRRLVCEVNGQKIYGINDIVFHNAVVTAGVRYRVRIDSTIYADEIVGDGLVVATPFGSSAYYRSITKSVFRVGLGLAFNNSTESVNHLVLSEDSTVEVQITRGPAVVVADNMINHLSCDRGDVLRICYSHEHAEIWELSTLTCRDCRSIETGRPAGFRHV